MSVLEIHNLKKSFLSPTGQNESVVDVPAFTLEDSEQVALIGGSGSGKTTLLNLIAGILSADSGVLKVKAKNIVDLSESERDAWRAEHIGYVFQTFNLLQGYSALENVEMGMRFGTGVNRKHALALLEEVGMTDRVDFKPRQLSVGQQQRVAVARALANNPALVLADEPTGNLDPELAAQSLNIIRNACKANGAALLLVTHDSSVMDQFERVIDLKDINQAMTQNMGEATGGQA